MDEAGSELVFVALGGLGEIGMNVALYGVGPQRKRKWLMVDCGVTFADAHYPGIDVVLPDLRFIEERLSDALHAGLTQRFVDKRTTALARKIGGGAGALPVEIDAGGEVTIDTHPIGRLEGFRFLVAPDANAAGVAQVMV